MDGELSALMDAVDAQSRAMRAETTLAYARLLAQAIYDDPAKKDELLPKLIHILIRSGD